MSTTRSSAATARRAWSWRPIDPLERTRARTEDEIRHGARGQPLPLHRLPQHRRSRARGAGREGACVGGRRSAQSAPRRARRTRELLTGQARFVDDLTLPGMLWLGVVRSPYAHARIKVSTRRRRARAAGRRRGVLGRRPRRRHGRPLPCAWPVTEDIKMPTHWPLARDKARYAGDGVAVVARRQPRAAKDAAELVEVDYEPLPAVTDVEARARRGCPARPRRVRDEQLLHVDARGGRGRRGCSRRPTSPSTSATCQQRLIPNAMEPRGVLAQPAPATGEYTLWSATQIPHILRVHAAMTLGIPEASSASSRPTSAAASARSSTSTPRSRSRSRSRASSAGR